MANNDALDDVSSSTTTACELDDNSELISAEVGIDCWEAHAERMQIVVDDSVKISQLPQLQKFDELQMTASELLANEAKDKKQAEGKYELSLMYLFAAWLKMNPQSIKIDEKEYAVRIGGKKWPDGPTSWAHNFRKSRMKNTLPDTQLYVDNGIGIQIGCIEMKNGKSGKGPATNQDDRCNIQQATGYAITFQRPTMSKTNGNGTTAFRLPALVLYEDCAYWLSLTSDDALIYPYTLAVRRYAFDMTNRDEAALRCAVAYLLSLLKPDSYEFNDGFQFDTSQLLLATSQLCFPPSGLQRTEWANNVFRGDTAALSGGYFIQCEFENNALKRQQSTTRPIVIKCVSAACYNMLNSAKFILPFLEELNRAESANVRAGSTSDGAQNDLVRGVERLNVGAGGEPEHEKEYASALSSIYNTYLWIGGRGERDWDFRAGYLIVTAYCGEQILSNGLLSKLFSKSNTESSQLREVFVKDVFLPAFAVVHLTGYCHLDIRPANVCVLCTGDSTHFRIIDWEEVVPVRELKARVQLMAKKDLYDGWYPSVGQVRGNHVARAMVFTGCQLFLCLFVMRCVEAGANAQQLQRDVRSKKNSFWTVERFDELVPMSVPSRQEFVTVTRQYYTYLRQLLEGKVTNTDATTIINELKDYACACVR